MEGATDAAGALGGVFGCVVPLGTALSLGLTLLEGLIHPKDGSLGTMGTGFPSKRDIQVLLPPCPSRDPPGSSGAAPVASQ